MDCLQVVQKANIKKSQQYQQKMKRQADRIYALKNKRFHFFISAQLILVLLSISFFLAADEIDLLSRIIIAYNFYTFPIMMYNLIKIMIQIRIHSHSKRKGREYLRVALQVPTFYLLIAAFIGLAEKQVEWPFIPNFLLNFQLFILPIILGTYFSWIRWQNLPTKSPLHGPPKFKMPKTFYRIQAHKSDE
jgi:hypothetical protein